VPYPTVLENIKLSQRESFSFESPAALVDWLMEQIVAEQPAMLGRYLADFDTAEQDELAVCLKKQADDYRRTDLDRCFQVAELIKMMAGLTGNELHYALGLRAEGNGYALALGECQNGIDCYDEAAKIYRRHGRKLDEAWSQIGKIFALANLGKSEEALAVGEWAQGVFRALEEWLPLAEVTVNMAIIQGQRGEDQKALQLLEQARELYLLFQSGDSDKRLLVVDMNRSILLRNLGRFEEAIAINLRIIEIALERANPVAAAKSQHNLAMTYFILGRYNEALALLDAAQRGFEEDGRYRDAWLVELFTGNCLLQLRRFNEAIEKCRHARQHLESPLNIAESLLYEGRALIGIEQYEEAYTALTAAKVLFENEGNSTAQADTDLYMAKVLLHQGQPEKALTLAQKSLAVFQDYNLPLGFVQAQLLSAQAAQALGQPLQARKMVAEVLNIARMHNFPTFAYQGFHLAGTIAAQAGNFQQALADWESGIDVLEQMYSHMMLEYRVDFAGDKMRLYEDVVGLYICQDKADVALTYAERAKSRALHDLLAYRLDLRIEARSEADQSLVDNILSLRDERNHLYRRWHSSKQPGEPEGIASELTAKQATGQQLLALEKQMTAAWHKLLVRNAAYAQDANLWQIRSEPVQPFLNKRTALVEYFVVRDQLVCFVITADSIQVVSLDATIKEAQQLLQLLGLNLRAVPHSSPERMTALTRNIQGVLHKLYQALFAPLHALVEDFEQLIIVPHGPLHYLPFHALYDGGHYLIEAFEVSYLPSSSLLRYCQEAEKVEGGLLTIGYSGDGRLPHAAREARIIAENWNGRAWVEEEATLTNLHRYAGQNRVLHLATHGEFRVDNPLFSGLILADGWLTTLDIFDLRLRASLVTLSACQTGRSVVGGGDELLGLLRAFLAAGAASLVSTFWAVEDMTTASLMNDFYRALVSGSTKGAALRSAQLEHIDQHPYFWSPFFLVGDTGPL
jgi:CHAT domain-containing protein